MLFLDLIFKNLFRNKKKFFLTLFGLSLIFLILLFPLVLLESSSDLSNGKVTISGDFIIEPKLNLDNLSSDLGVKSSANVPFYYDADYLNNHFSLFNNVSGVNGLFYIVSGEYTELGSDNYFINSTDLNKLNLSIIEGNVFSNSSQVIIAKNLARDSDKNVGDNLLIKGKNYTVSGIFEGNSYFSYSIIRSLDVWKSSSNISLNESNMEDLSLSNQSNSLVSGENQGEFGKLIFIGNFTADANKDQIRNNINSIDSNWICVDSLDNSQDVQVTNQLNSSLYLLIECIVLIINGIILIYSFVSSIDDKIKDLAILKAVGWNNKRLIAFVLSESILIVFIGGLLVFSLTYILMTIYLSIYYPGDFVIFNWTIFINFFGTILLCGLIGSLYYVYKIIKLELANVLSN